MPRGTSAQSSRVRHNTLTALADNEIMLEIWNPKVVCALTRLVPISFTGRDVQAFLQGQLTLDVREIKEEIHLAGYCDPRGRLLATPRLFRMDEAIWALVPKDSADALVARLRLYTLRRDVTIAKQETWRVYGTLGACARQNLPPSAKVFSLPFTTLLVTQEAVEAQADEALWWREAVLARRPWVFEATRGRFLPQSLNLDTLGAVSFTKGCYTGQEVVARVHNIGRVARRMHLYTGPSRALAAGTDLAGESGVAFATLVYASLGAYLFEVPENNMSERLVLDENTTLERVPASPQSTEGLAHG